MSGCAKRAKLPALALFLFSACLNPMPEEFPSNDDRAVVGVQDGPTFGGSLDGESGRPTLPEGNGSGFLEEGAGGSGGASNNGAPPATQVPIDDGAEAEAPDAGVDAGTTSTGVEDTSPEGETAP